MQLSDFGFGIEAEFLLTDSDFRPLAYKDLNFQKLLKLVESIQTGDISRAGFNTKPLHNSPSPYLIEGYCLTDANMKPVDLLPKGIEIRTPLSHSINDCTTILQELYKRLKAALATNEMNAAMISHHPTAERLEATANYERYDYWQWALTATTTYGPDINLSVPIQCEQKLDIKRTNARINYYGPAAIALTLASPLYKGDLWRIDGGIGKSKRTFERSKWAPIFYLHEKPSLRFEFKGFEMSRCIEDYQALFLICLALLLDENLDNTDSDATRIANLESIAISGVEQSVVQERASRVLESAEKIAHQFDFPRHSLDEFWQRLQTRRLPADDIIDTFERTNSVAKTLSTLTDFFSQSALSKSGSSAANTATTKATAVTPTTLCRA